MPDKPDNTPTLAHPQPAEPVERTQTYVPAAPLSAAGPPPTSAGRYSLLSEIGRGGMGIIYEAEDAELHRHLAVKLLQEEYQDDPKLVRRFLDEARICGQLQHPGVVPIHELGRLPDRRPFFTMKLIRGQTLAALLQARSDPGEDLPRFLGIFEQVCQTMAYAHSRGIIHRDLKPANIMVGSFGEVQVMDWGLAKVLSTDKPQASALSAPSQITDNPEPELLGDAADSVAGSVMGTPGFMAPEQARGAIEEMDARCDVFGLGAILCVILTGKPPYDGTTQPEVYQQAVDANLNGAYERLRKCAADGELVRLARHCLAADAKDRPCDAGVVALAMTDYRVSVADRLREAELAKASAQAKAVAERQARRLTVALAISLVALLSVGGWGWLWRERERAEKRTLLAGQVEREIEQALRLREQGRAAPIGELNVWAEARAVARQAKDRVTGGEVDAELRQRVEALAAKLERELTDRRMLARLEEIRLRKSELKDNHFDIRGAAAEYAAAFRDYGIDTASLSTEEAAERMGKSAIAAELAAALDDWSETVTEEAPRRRLLDLARQADADPWRQRLRTALAQRDRRALTAAAQSKEVIQLPPATLYLLGKALAEVGDPDGCVRLLRQAQRLYPDDFWLNFHLATQLAGGNPPRHDEAIRFYTAALAVRKHSAGAYLSLGNALASKGALAESIGAFEEAIRLKPDYAPAYNNKGNALADLGRLEEAGAAYHKAIALKPDYARAHSNLAVSLLRRGRTDDALAASRKAILLDRRDAGFYNVLGSILAQKERWEEAIAAYRRAAELDANYTQPRANLARVLHQSGRLAESVAVYRQTLRMRPKSEWLRIDLGRVLEKQGELDAAIALYKEAIRLKLDSIPARLSLASALDGRGRTEDAIAACREALNIAPDDAETHCLLGLFLQKRGKLTEAREELRRGHALGSHQPSWTRPSEQWLRRCEQSMETEKKIPALRRGEAMDLSIEEKIDLANLCMQGHTYYADSARLFRAAFAARPEWVKEYRYQAARAAALAAAGKGADAKNMTEEERAAWRKQAVSWLQAELAAWQQRSQSGDEMERGAVKKALRNWRDDTALAGLREAMELNKLPEAEREACRQLWKEVDALLKKLSPSNRAALAGRCFLLPDKSLLSLPVADVLIHGARWEGKEAQPDIAIENRLPFARENMRTFQELLA